MEPPIDIKAFDTNLSKFLALMKEIINCHEQRKLNLSSNKNPVLTRLEKYIKTYDRTKPEEHIWYFKKIYESNCPAILRGPEKDNWLKTGNIIIQFGEDVGRSTDIKIHLSIIYGTACKLQSDTKKSLAGLPNLDESEELMYPNLFLLHLYRIFYEIAETKGEKEQISSYINSLEKSTGNKNTKKESNDPLNGILGTVTDLMGQMGMKLPEGQKLPSQDDLGKMLGSVMNNPQTKSLLGNMMQEMKECKNLGDVVNKLVNNLGSVGVDPATQQTLKDNLNNATSSFSEGNGDDEFLD